MSCSPMPIRRNVVTHTYEPASAIDLATTPGGRNVYGSTPGGSKIVYSREQLLTLASSPLSAQQHFNVPDEISRSPTSPVRRSPSSKEEDAGTQPWSRKSTSPPTTTTTTTTAAAPLSQNGTIVNGSSRSTFVRSAPRNPGNAFNFSKGPITATTTTTTNNANGSAASLRKHHQPATAAPLTNGAKYFKHPDDQDETFDIEI